MRSRCAVCRPSSISRLACLVILASVSFYSACKDSSDGVQALSYSEAAIGPEGGSIETSNGARITVPPGALDETVTIQLAAYGDSLQLQRQAGLNSMSGAVSLNPDGLTFSIPATLDIPLFASAIADAEYPLFLFDEEQRAWIQEDSLGRVTGSGDALQASIDHFSSYATSSSFGGGLTDFIDEYESPASAQTAFDSFVENFMSQNNLMNQRKREGDKCYTVCGVEFDIMTHYAGIEDQFIDLVGDRSEEVERLQYYADRLVQDGDAEYQVIFDIKANIYWQEVECEAGENWSGTMSYEYYFNSGVTEEWASYSIDFNFNVVLDAILEVDGVALATQEVSAEVTAGGYINSIDAEPTIDLLIDGWVDSDGFIRMKLFVDEDNTRLFTYEICVDGGSCGWSGNCENLIVSRSDTDDVVKVPLEEGTHEGQHGTSGFNLHTYTVTFQRDG